MKLIVSVMLLAIATISTAQSPSQGPTVKGHRIGETLLEYLTVTKGSTEAAQFAIDDCVSLLANPKTQKRYSKTANSIDDSDLRFRREVDQCSAATAISTGKTDIMRDELQMYTFESAKLVAMQLTILDSFAKVTQDLAAKFGPPDAVEDVRFQNAFGASFVHPRAIWKPDARPAGIVASESPDPIIDTPGIPKIYAITVVIEAREYAEKLLAKERNRPSSLD